MQNFPLPLIAAPHLGQVGPSASPAAALAASSADTPHSAQNFPVIGFPHLGQGTPLTVPAPSTAFPNGSTV